MAGIGRAQVTPPPDRPASDDKTVELERVEVTATDEDEGYDATGMGSVEEEMRDEPFGNDLISATDFALDADSLALAGQIAAIAEASPADRIAGQDRLNLRGFPTPTLRNSFIQVGVPEVLNTGQTVVIQGPLVPVLGRAAPGGIQNFISARPRAKAQLRTGVSASNRGRTRASLEWTGPVVPKKNWQRLAAEWTHRSGPEQFAEEDTFAASAALTFRHSRTASTMVEFDYRRIDALASPGVPEFIPVGATKSAGPYRPLALFNANGPDAGIRRESAYLGLQFDTQPRKGLALRASLGAWRRELEQERFTTSRLDLATGFFAGVREPRHLEQPQHAFIAQLEGTLRYRRFGAEHKLLAAASHTWGRYLREERALTVSDRNQLPADALHFDPAAPNYFRPHYRPDLYRRVITDRLEHARYGSVELSDRAAWKNGLTVVTAGLRYDSVALEIEDRRPGATLPRTEDRTSQWSGHLGVNHQVRRGKLLAFASTSSAFDPSTPVDARTGRIQDNETTVGHEAGLKGRVGLPALQPQHRPRQPALQRPRGRRQPDAAAARRDRRGAVFRRPGRAELEAAPGHHRGVQGQPGARRHHRLARPAAGSEPPAHAPAGIHAQHQRALPHAGSRRRPQLARRLAICLGLRRPLRGRAPLFPRLSRLRARARRRRLVVAAQEPPDRGRTQRAQPARPRPAGLARPARRRPRAGLRRPRLVLTLSAWTR